mgnify:CR=1 FL=1
MRVSRELFGFIRIDIRGYYLPSALEIDESPVGAFTDMTQVDDLLGMTGFIRSFNTTFSGEQLNSVAFNLDFEIATVLAENPINSL